MPGELTDSPTSLPVAVCPAYQVDVLHRVLRDGMDPDLLDDQHRTPLHWAAESGNYRYHLQSPHASHWSQHD